jgi:tripartite-type tricarboxylate transporter receptor subunit TctC
MEREALLGTSGGNTIDIPLAISRIVGAKLKFVKGYRGTNEVLLAMEKGEVVGLGGVGFDTLMASRGGNLECCRVLIQTGERPDRDFPDVPLVKELARTDEQRAALSVTFAGLSLGRSFVTNDVGAEKLAALRAAFEKTMADPEFRADAARQRLPVNPMTWRESEAVIARFHSAPPHIIEEARRALAPDE